MNTHHEPIDRNHPLSETAAAELSKKFMPGLAFQMLANVSPEDLTEYARLAYDLGREHERTNPEDDRPWEPLNGPVRVGDEVRQEAFGFAVTAVVARMDGRGDPLTAEGAIIGDLRHGTWYVRRTVPAPTPPAEEVELQGEHPAHLLDVEITGRAKCVHMELDRYGYWIGVDQEGYPRQWPLRWIAAFTLPDGTRARRDGEHEDGEPRFVKVQEGEK